MGGYSKVDLRNKIPLLLAVSIGLHSLVERPQKLYQYRARQLAKATNLSFCLVLLLVRQTSFFASAEMHPCLTRPVQRFQHQACGKLRGEILRDPRFPVLFFPTSAVVYLSSPLFHSIDLSEVSRLCLHLLSYLYRRDYLAIGAPAAHPGEHLLRLGDPGAPKQAAVFHLSYLL